MGTARGDDFGGGKVGHVGTVHDRAAGRLHMLRKLSIVFGNHHVADSASQELRQWERCGRLLCSLSDVGCIDRLLRGIVVRRCGAIHGRLSLIELERSNPVPEAICTNCIRVHSSLFMQQKGCGLWSVFILPSIVEQHSINSASVWSHDGLNIVESPASILLGIRRHFASLRPMVPLIV